MFITESFSSFWFSMFSRLSTYGYGTEPIVKYQTRKYPRGLGELRSYFCKPTLVDEEVYEHVIAY